MGPSAVLAIVMLFLFRKTGRTDGPFTAFGVYNIVAIVAQSLRTTIVARLVEGPSLWDAFDRDVTAVLFLAVAIAVPLAVLAGPLAHLLTGDASGDTYDTARTALWLFSVAGAAVLLAALGAAATRRARSLRGRERRLPRGRDRLDRRRPRAGRPARSHVGGRVGDVAVLRALLPGHWELVRRLLAPVAGLRRSAA
jgi:hypothetical protein